MYQPIYCEQQTCINLHTANSRHVSTYNVKNVKTHKPGNKETAKIQGHTEENVLLQYYEKL
jgi:hypothetical protein